jgi:hypothetical protein
LAVALMCFYGPSGKTIGQTAQTLQDKLIPSTTRAWGVLAMVASFLLLGIGAMVSFRKRKVAAPKADEAVPPETTDSDG